MAEQNSNEFDRQAAISQAKMLLGIKGVSEDEILSFLLDDSVQLVISYCKRKSLPNALFSLIPQIAADRYRISDYGKAQPDKILTSVSQGSRSESYASPDIYDNSFLKNYEARLKPFICKRGYVPSDFDTPDNSD